MPDENEPLSTRELEFFKRTIAEGNPIVGADVAARILAALETLQNAHNKKCDEVARLEVSTSQTLASAQNDVDAENLRHKKELSDFILGVNAALLHIKSPVDRARVQKLIEMLTQPLFT